jgi:hypothetical protein
MREIEDIYFSVILFVAVVIGTSMLVIALNNI